MIRILISDAQEIARAGLMAVIEADDGFQVVGDFGCVQGTLAAVKRMKCDVLILDLEQTGQNYLVILQKIRELSPQLAVFILTNDTNYTRARRALTAGALGFNDKGISPSELISAIKLVASGRRSINERLALRLLAEVSPKHCGQSTLTPREHEVYLRLARGNTYAAIARELDISVKTIATHKGHIFTKLQLDNMSRLIQHAIVSRVMED